MITDRIFFLLAIAGIIISAATKNWSAMSWAFAYMMRIVRDMIDGES